MQRKSVMIQVRSQLIWLGKDWVDQERCETFSMLKERPIIFYSSKSCTLL